ncbi:MAG: tetratricopeptide repeat protein, partial [Gammaproteobacteria bacterium]|nr:tetratricopeptide repeat protein [Gammaproteobacteria bacterium]
QSYLQARFLAHQPSAENLENARIFFLEAIDLDPQFAEAYASLAFLYTNIADFTALTTDEALPKAEEYAQRALELNPNVIDAHVVLAKLAHVKGDPIEAENTFLRALEIDPNHTEVFNSYAQFLVRVGKPNEALDYFQELYTRDPVPWITKDWLSYIYMLLGDEERCIHFATEAINMGQTNPYIALYDLYLNRGDYERAQEAFTAFLSKPVGEERAAEFAAILMNGIKNETERAKALDIVPEIANYFGRPKHRLLHAYLDLGAMDEAFALFDGPVSARMLFSANHFWKPQASSFRRHPKFKEIMHKYGFVEYWKQNGWGTYCRPTAEDFECD